MVNSNVLSGHFVFFRVNVNKKRGNKVNKDDLAKFAALNYFSYFSMVQVYSKGKFKSLQ